MTHMTPKFSRISRSKKGQKAQAKMEICDGDLCDVSRAEKSDVYVVEICVVMSILV